MRVLANAAVRTRSHLLDLREGDLAAILQENVVGVHHASSRSRTDAHGSQQERDEFERHDLATGIRWVGGQCGGAGGDRRSSERWQRRRLDAESQNPG